MRKASIALSTLALLVLSGTAGAVTVKLTAHNQRSSSGTLSTLKWDGCTTFNTTTACINPANAKLASMGITPSTAVWDWNAATHVLSMTGTFNTASTLGSSGAAAASVVIGDRVVDLVINTANQTTTAASYLCAEGNFLASVGAHGCANVTLGEDFVYNSSVAYNVLGDARCVQRSLVVDDVSTGNPRGLATVTGLSGCDDTDGAFNFWTVLTDDTATGGQLVVSNGIATSAAGTNYLTFTASPDAANDGPFNAPQDVDVTLDVLANDVNFTDPVTVTILTPPTKGTAVVTGSPGNRAAIRIVYTADSAATGPDSFVYSVLNSDNVNSDSATVTLNTLAFGANDDTATTTRNSPAISINVGANDVGLTDPVTVTITGPPDASGTATPGASGPAAGATISYTPALTAAFTATYTETFTYTVTDANSLASSGTVTVTVNNTVPVAGDGALTISTQGVDPASRTGAFNAGTFAGNSLGNGGTVTVSTAATKGTATVSGNVVNYVPSGTFFQGTDTFGYTITDNDPGAPEADSGTVTVTIADVSPTLGGGTITTTANTASAPKALVFVAGNGSVDQHTLAVTTAATNGTCALSGTSLVYTPNADYTGADSCVVTITDEAGAGDSATGTFTITVNAAGGGGGGGSGGLLPGGSGATDPLSLVLLASLPLLGRLRAARRRQAVDSQ